MAYSAGVLADSISSRGERLTTLEVTFPRFVLAEFNTHRILSRNSASSRAVPVTKRIAEAIEDPFIPEDFGKNQPGMQAEEELTDEEKQQAEAIWLWGRDQAVIGAVALIGGTEGIRTVMSDQDRADALVERIEEIYERAQTCGPEPLKTAVHKQLGNRGLETYLWNTAIVTSTEWDNFYALRANPAAQPEIRRAAYLMQAVYTASRPQELDYGEWHLPLVRIEDMNLPPDLLLKIAIGRCARISYLTHAGRRDPQADIGLHEQLLSEGHMSPFEHVARPMKRRESILPKYRSNFTGWVQYRKLIPNESNYANVLKQRKKLDKELKAAA